MIMPLTSMMPMLLRAPAPGPGREDEREVADDGGRGRHQDRAQPRAGRLDDRRELVLARLLKVVGELHDQDAVLRHQADQRDQPDLAVDVERRQSQEREQQRAREIASGTEPARMMNGSRKLSNCAASTR